MVRVPEKGKWEHGLFRRVVLQGEKTVVEDDGPQKGSTKPVTIASLSKYAILLAAAEKIKKEGVDPRSVKLKITPEDVTLFKLKDGNRIPLKAGQTITLRQALELTHGASSNGVAAGALQRWVYPGETQEDVVKDLNKLARSRLGLKENEPFKLINASGHPIGRKGDPDRQDAQATPADIARLATHLETHYPDVLNFPGGAIHAGGGTVRPTSPLNYLSADGKTWMRSKTGTDTEHRIVTVLHTDGQDYTFYLHKTRQSHTLSKAQAASIRDFVKEKGIKITDEKLASLIGLKGNAPASEIPAEKTPAEKTTAEKIPLDKLPPQIRPPATEPIKALAYAATSQGPIAGREINRDAADRLKLLEQRAGGDTRETQRNQHLLAASAKSGKIKEMVPLLDGNGNPQQIVKDKKTFVAFAGKGSGKIYAIEKDSTEYALATGGTRSVSSGAAPASRSAAIAAGEKIPLPKEKPAEIRTAEAKTPLPRPRPKGI